MEQNLMAV